MIRESFVDERNTDNKKSSPKEHFVTALSPKPFLWGIPRRNLKKKTLFSWGKGAGSPRGILGPGEKSRKGPQTGKIFCPLGLKGAAAPHPLLDNQMAAAPHRIFPRW